MGQHADESSLGTRRTSRRHAAAIVGKALGVKTSTAQSYCTGQNSLFRRATEAVRALHEAGEASTALGYAKALLAELELCLRRCGADSPPTSESLSQIAGTSISDAMYAAGVTDAAVKFFRANWWYAPIPQHRADCIKAVHAQIAASAHLAYVLDTASPVEPKAEDLARFARLADDAAHQQAMRRFRRIVEGDVRPPKRESNRSAKSVRARRAETPDQPTGWMA